MCLDDDCTDCLCQMLLCAGCCLLCKKCCGCDEPQRPTVTHETVIIQQPGPNNFQQPMYDPNQAQWQQQQAYYAPQQQAYYPPAQQAYYPAQQQSYPPAYGQPPYNPQFQQGPQYPTQMPMPHQ